MEKFERRKVSLKQLVGAECAWRDCQQLLEPGEMPKGWTYLLSYWAKRPARNLLAIPQRDCFRDAVLKN
jgi:hypothetical protein